MKLANLYKKGKDYYTQKIISSAKPMIHSIEPTNCCRFSCKMCPRRFMKRKVGMMSIDLFRKIVAQIKGQEIITLHHFGDPLLCPWIDKMIEACHEQGIKCSFSTNPASLTKDNVRKILDSGLDYIHISLDGATAKTYRAVRGKNADYDDAIEKIYWFLVEKEKRKSKLHVIIAIIHMKETEKEIEDFKTRWSAMSGIDEIQVKPFIRWDGASKDINSLASDKMMAKKYKKDKSFACFWPWSRLVVLWDGKVVPCCYCYDHQVLLGDLSRQTIVCL